LQRLLQADRDEPGQRHEAGDRQRPPPVDEGGQERGQADQGRVD
jgi:hypothetical protein